MNIMRQSACLVIKLITVYSYRLKHGIGADLSFIHVISMLQKNCVIKEHFTELCRKALSDLVCPKFQAAYIALVRWPPCELNISCTSTTTESRAKIWYQ